MGNSEENSRYKDLLVWQRSLTFADEVIDLIDIIQTSRKHYRLFEQLEAAVTSVPMNIAEGMQSTPLGKVGIHKKNSCISSILPEAPFTKH